MDLVVLVVVTYNALPQQWNPIVVHYNALPEHWNPIADGAIFVRPQRTLYTVSLKVI